MQGNEASSQEKLVFLFEWQSKAIDNGAENLEKLGNPIESLGLVDELKEYIID